VEAIMVIIGDDEAQEEDEVEHPIMKDDIFVQVPILKEEEEEEEKEVRVVMM